MSQNVYNLSINYTKEGNNMLKKSVDLRIVAKMLGVNVREIKEQITKINGPPVVKSGYKQ